MTDSSLNNFFAILLQCTYMFHIAKKSFCSCDALANLFWVRNKSNFVAQKLQCLCNGEPKILGARDKDIEEGRLNKVGILATWKIQ